MKNIFLVISTLTLFSLSSCKKFLDTSSPSSLSSETVYSSASMAKAAIMGLYGDMTNTYIYGQKLSVNWQGVTDIESNGAFTESGYNSTSSDAGAGTTMVVSIILRPGGPVCMILQKSRRRPWKALGNHPFWSQMLPP